MTPGALRAFVALSAGGVLLWRHYMYTTKDLTNLLFLNIFTPKTIKNVPIVQGFLRVFDALSAVIPTTTTNQKNVQTLLFFKHLLLKKCLVL